VVKEMLELRQRQVISKYLHSGAEVMPRARQVRSEYRDDDGGAAWTALQNAQPPEGLVSFLVNSGMGFSSTSGSVGQRP
jgi:hypothetical protein